MVEPVYPFRVTSERNLEAQTRTENLIWLHPKEHLSVEHSMQKRGPSVWDGVLRLLWGLPARDVWVVTSNSPCLKSCGGLSKNGPHRLMFLNA